MKTVNILHEGNQHTVPVSFYDAWRDYAYAGFLDAASIGMYRKASEAGHKPADRVAMETDFYINHV